MTISHHAALNLWEGQVARIVGISPEMGDLVRIGQAVVWRVLSRRMIVRAERVRAPSILEQRLNRVRMSAAAGVPLLVPIPFGDDQDVHYTSDGWAVTVWPLAEPVSQWEFDWEWIGHALQALHSVRPPDSVAFRDPRLKVRGDLEIIRSMPLPVDIEDLELAVQGRLNRAYAAGPHVTVHGDAHPGNAVSLGGRLLLTDFESLGAGSASWDLATVQILHTKYGVPEDAILSAMRSYGGLVAASSELAARALPLREALDGLSVARRALSDPRLWAEGEKRLLDLVGERTSTWLSVHPGNERWLSRHGVTINEAIKMGVGVSGADIPSLTGRRKGIAPPPNVL